MPPEMLLPTARIHKLFIAQTARERSLARMYTRMHNHILLQCEILATIRTLVRFFTRMGFHVGFQMGRLHEIPTAHAANIRFLAGVDASMVN